MKNWTFALAVIVGGFFAAPTSAWAEVIHYKFEWAGPGGYTMTGRFSYDEDDAVDGAIRDNEVRSLSFRGFLDGAPIGRNSTAPSLPVFNFNFDTVAEQFFLNDLALYDNGQSWNQDGPAGLGFAAGGVVLGALLERPNTVRGPQPGTTYCDPCGPRT